MPARRQRGAAVLLAMLALVVAAPVWAQSADDLDENQQQQDELDSRLEILEADHAELEAALEATTARVREQEAAKRAAEQRLEAARAEVRAAQAAVAEMQAEIVELGHQADEDAVDLYMNPDPTLTVMDTDDLTQATRRDALLSTIASRHSDVLDRLGGLEIDLVDAEARTREAAAAVEAERAEVAARLADYQATLRRAAATGVGADRPDRRRPSRGRGPGRGGGIHPGRPGPGVPGPDHRSRRLRRAPRPAPPACIWPADGTITGVFGEDRGDHMHAGIDIANSSGHADLRRQLGHGASAAAAAATATASSSTTATAWSRSTPTRRSIFVGSGPARRAAASTIGYMGCTGSCTGPHLHFETRINGTPYDPQAYLPRASCACNWSEAGGWAKPSWPACSPPTGPPPARSESSRPWRLAGLELTERFPDIEVTDTVGPAEGTVLATKPGDIAAACAALGADAGRVLSIAAGVRLADLEAALPSGTAVVRAMPNTPALVGAGAAAIAAGTAATDDDLAWAESILSAVGIVVRVAEPLLDAVTGLSGSGPAYVFLVAEALIEAGVLVGLPRPVAAELAGPDPARLGPAAGRGRRRPRGPAGRGHLTGRHDGCGPAGARAGRRPGRLPGRRGRRHRALPRAGRGLTGWFRLTPAELGESTTWLRSAPGS